MQGSFLADTVLIMVAARGVPTMRVVPTLQPVKDRHLRLRLGPESPSVEHFALEVSTEPGAAQL